jgi:hypothetical protein
MFAKKITYTDFSGETRTEEFLFNMSKTDIVQWQYSVKGGIDALFKKVTNEGDQPALIALLKDLIHRAYGERSVDGKKFEKRRNGVDLADEFEQTAAYDVLFMELVQSDTAASEFLNGIMPPDLVAQMNAAPKLPDGSLDINAIKAAHK